MSNYCPKGHWENGMKLPCKQCEIESLRQQLAECQAREAKRITELRIISRRAKDFCNGRTPIQNAPYFIWQSAEAALALPNDATALNELIEAKVAERTAEVEKQLNAMRKAWNVDELIAERMKTQKEYYESVFQDGANRIAELTAEVERLKSESAAFASNLRGKHATTGATYQYLIQQNAELTAELQSTRLQMITDFGQYQEAHEKVKELTAEVERLKAITVPVNIDYGDGPEEVAYGNEHQGRRLKKWLDKYFLIRQQNAELTAQRDAAISTIEYAYKVAVEHDDRIQFDWAMYCEMLHAAIVNCKEQK